MRNLFILIIIFRLTALFGQEQVSDIKYFGVHRPTFLQSHVGFAYINGHQYLLKENDSLTIFKIVDGELIPKQTIKSFKGKDFPYSKGFKNRSYFSIVDKVYYRFYHDGFQVIDIETGEVTKEIDYASEGQINIDKATLHKERMYLELRKEGKKQTRVIDLSNDSFETLVLPQSRFNFPQIADLLPGVQDGNKLYIYNAVTKKDSLVYKSNTNIRFVLNSFIDSSFIFIEGNGSVWKVDQNLQLQSTNCIIEKSYNINKVHLNGTKLIILHSDKDADFNTIEKVKVYDYYNCQTDLDFALGPKEQYATSFNFVTNENNISEFTILGYSGFNPTDGFSKGLYYIIDHKLNRFKEIQDISGVDSYSPFIFDNHVYCLVSNSSFWGSFSYIVKYNLSTSEITKHYPEGEYETTDMIFGFVHDEKLSLVTNSRKEDVMLWEFDKMNIFHKKAPIDYTYNLGVHDIKSLFPMSDRLYFSNSTGLYSMFKDVKTELEFITKSKLLYSVWNNNSIQPIASFNEKLAFAEIYENKLVFKILNTKSNVLDSFIVIGKFSTITAPVGPFLFFREGNSNSKVQFLDLKDNSFGTSDALQNISIYGLVQGKENAIYIDEASNLSEKTTVYLIDYTTNEISKLDISFNDHLKVVAGYDDSYYFIDYHWNSKKSKIRLLKKNGELSLIYEGEGTYYGNRNFYKNSNNKTMLLYLISQGKNLTLITDNHEDISIEKLEHFSSNFYEDILHTKNDNYVFTTKNNLGDNYWFYKAYRPLVKLAETNKNRLVFSDLNDSLTVLVFQTTDSVLNIIVYDILNNDLKTIEIKDLTCVQYNKLFGAFLNNSQIILHLNCDLGIEPYILDLNKETLELLSDILPGEQSSYPRDFVHFRDFIFFTALTSKDQSRQWFRISISGPSPTIEQVKSPISKPKVYPSPASDIIYLDESSDEIYIMDINGQIVFRSIKYQSQQSIDIRHLLNGSYFVVCKSDDGQFRTGSFIKAN